MNVSYWLIRLTFKPIPTFLGNVDMSKYPLNCEPDAETSFPGTEDLYMIRTFITVDPPVFLHPLGQTGRLESGVVQFAPIYPVHWQVHSVDQLFIY